MKKILYVFSAALLCLVSCTQGLNFERSVRTTTVPPAEGDMARVTFYVTVPEAPLYATQTKAPHAMGEQPNAIENGDLYVAIFGKGANGIGGQLQHFVKATLMKDPATEPIGIDPPIDHDLTGDSDEGEGIAGKTFKYAYQVLLPISEDGLVLDFFAGAYDSDGILYSLDNPLPVAYEAEVMPLLRSIDGNAAYWQRVEINGVKPATDDNGDYIMAQVFDEDGMPISSEAEEYEADDIPELHDIRLVRNFAKVTFTANSSDFDLNGFYLVDTPVYGTVAPYSGSSGYANAYTTSTDAAAIMASYKGYITSTELTSGIPDGSNFFFDPGEYVYMYERTVPDLNKPYGETGAILDVTWHSDAAIASKLDGNLHRYYKVSFVDNSGAVPILRNIVYNFQVSDIVADAHPTNPADAYSGPFLGDISANIATSMLDEITNNRSLIKVSEMSKTTIGDGRDIDIDFWFYPDVQNHPNDVVVNHNTAFQGQTVTIQIIDEEVAGYQPAIASFVNLTPSNADMGVIRVTTNSSVAGSVKKSKLKILGQWGTQRALYREVEFTVMEKQYFENDGVTCYVSKLSEDSANQDVTVTIVLPNELPRDVFPLDIMIEPENNGLRSVPHNEGGVTLSALPVKHGVSAFDATKRNYFFVKTITYDDYAELVNGSYQYTNEFPCYFKTRLSSGNETSIKINDLNKEYFVEDGVALSL